MIVFDHLAIAAERLGDAAAVAAALGVPLEPGGAHAAFGTHNRLLSLGPGAYLEVIAVDPEAPPPGRARWFGLDGFAGAPRPVGWIARSDGLDLWPGAGPALTLSRGVHAWTITVPEDGRPQMGGALPGLIRWRGPHPADVLPDRGVRLAALTLAAPDPAGLRAVLAPHLDDPRIAVVAGMPGLSAVLDTPRGRVIL
ncbi:MAG: VOC family protein [Gemmobacter sp.]